ncbi:MAG TPA: hypothetical protein VNO81_03970, partial [Candidatus Nitrosotenuis sp.]|nr:hypothetical protein [Candidatus Nitrosotenuis sp.]
CPLEGRTPLLEEMAALAQGTPLRGVRLLALVHFLQDLPAFVRALETLGLDITRATFYYRTPDYPQREAITDWLLGRGARVISMTLLEKDLRSLSDQPDPAPLLVLDDRGEIYKTILQKTPLVAPRVRGVIEQTARGAWAVEEALDDAPPGAEAPVICAVDSAWRKKVEAPLVGRAVYESLARLMPGQDPRLLRVGILGYGALGRTLARLFDEAGADVGVYDPDYRRRVESEEQGFLTHGRTFHAVQGCHLVIAASGRCDLGEQDILNMKADAYLASATAEHSELALGDLENLARRRLPHTVDGRLCGTEYILHKGDRRLILLANGYPVNYWGMEGLPPGLSDLAYTLLLVALVKTLGSRLPPGINSGVIDQLAERYHLAELYARHHPLERRPNAP